MRAKTNVIVENCNEPVEYNVRAIEKQVPPPPTVDPHGKTNSSSVQRGTRKGKPQQGLFPSYTPQIHMFGPRAPQHQTYRDGRGFNYITTHGFLFLVYIFVFIYLLLLHQRAPLQGHTLAYVRRPPHNQQPQPYL